MGSFKKREGASGTPPPLQEEKKSPVLRINASSF